jgi:hypothetical protein
LGHHRQSDGLSEQFVLEVKAPTKVKNEKYYVNSKGLTNKVKVQLQLQMLLTGKKTGFLCLASPMFESDRKVETYREDFDEPYIMSLMEQAVTFWQQNIIPIISKKKSLNNFF